MKKLLITSILLLSSGLSVSSSEPKQARVCIDTKTLEYSTIYHGCIPYKKLEVNEVGSGGDTALGGAIDYGSYSDVEWLLSYGSNPNLIVVDSNGEQQSFLHKAVGYYANPCRLNDRENNFEIMKVLIRYGADINYASPARPYLQNGRQGAMGTPLNYAAQRYEECVDMINKTDSSNHKEDLQKHLEWLVKKMKILIIVGAKIENAPDFEELLKNEHLFELLSKDVKVRAHLKVYQSILAKRKELERLKVLKDLKELERFKKTTFKAKPSNFKKTTESSK